MLGGRRQSRQTARSAALQRVAQLRNPQLGIVDDGVHAVADQEDVR